MSSEPEAVRIARQALAHDVQYQTRNGTPTRDDDLDRVRMTREPLLAACVLHQHAELERLRGDEAVMLLSRRIGLGEPVRPDIHARVVAKLAAMTAARDELVEIALKSEHYRMDNEQRIKQLAKVGRV